LIWAAIVGVAEKQATRLASATSFFTMMLHRKMNAAVSDENVA
jgi:hypothetical protein